MATPKTTRCGLVALVGRPNVGKSTFLNHVLGEKLAAVSPKAQTTRRRLRGILSDETTQVIFVDTPGMHVAPPGKTLNEVCVAEAEAAIKDADVVIYLVDGTRPFQPEKAESDEHFVLKAIRKSREKHKFALFLALNKADQWQKSDGKFASQEELQAVLEQLGLKEIYPISARLGKGVPELMNAVRAALPEGPFLFPEDDISDESMRSIAVDLIQEQLFLHLGDELPYETGVEIDRYKDPEGTKRITEIDAFIHVNRESQKAMVIGAKGSKVKEIGQAARARLEEIIGNQVMLRLQVKVTPKWTQNREELRRLGYAPQKG